MDSELWIFFIVQIINLIVTCMHYFHNCKFKSKSREEITSSGRQIKSKEKTFDINYSSYSNSDGSTISIDKSGEV